MTGGYAYDHAWDEELLRLRGLELVLDPGTRDHLLRLGVRPGSRCLEIGAGAGAIACWLAEQVAPNGIVVATDLETDFLEIETSKHPNLQVLRHDLTAEDLPDGFDYVHARYLLEWLPDKAPALQRMVAALRPGGVLLDEEPDFVTIFETPESSAMRHVMLAAMRYLESTCPVDTQYGRRLHDDLIAAGLDDVQAEGRCTIVRGASPPAAHFLRLTVEKLREPLIAGKRVSELEFDEAVSMLEDPTASVMFPLTVAAWGRRS
ncbi:MAG TPA: methyltransferase [Acidimicrobiia bacterium]|nr:methyltransferase [Acidimicrobiia bacterium]